LTPNSRSYLNQFTQPDSIIPQQYDPQSWNRYEYGFDNPIKNTDPTGHDPQGDCYDRGYCDTPPSSTSGNGDQASDCTTVTCKALNGDGSSILDLLTPTHGGLRVQLEGSVFIMSGSVGLNVVYNRIDGHLAGNLDWSLEGGPGVGAGASVTGGPLIGWGSSHVEDSTSGNSAIVSASAAAEGAASVSVTAPIEGSITNPTGFHVDPHYGQVPATVYLGGGGGGAYASAGLGATGTWAREDLSWELPWNWFK
jgi:hypothetical protein